MAGSPYCLQCGDNGDQLLAGSYFCIPCKRMREREHGAREAVAAVWREIRSGNLSHPASCICAVCGGPAAEYDHRDYSRPLDVRPVCKPCNRKAGPAKWVRFLPLREILKLQKAGA